MRLLPYSAFANYDARLAGTSTSTPSRTPPDIALSVVRAVTTTLHFILILILVLPTPANAWSGPPPPSPSPAAAAKRHSQHRSTVCKGDETPDHCYNNRSRRRDVLRGIATTSFGLLVGGSGGGGTSIAPAAAATKTATPSSSSKKIYEPAPSSLNGKTILITGGTSGLGLESAKRLSAAGATVVITARTQAKGLGAIGTIQRHLADRSIDNPSVYSLPLDLDDLDSVRSFPQRYRALPLGGAAQHVSTGTFAPIDVLMNNAGVAAIPQREITKDGFERTFQTNHVAPFVLTSLLFPYLNRKGEGCRIINVSSYAHELATLTNNQRGLDLNNLNGDVDYSGAGWPAYCRSKLENVLFTNELQRRADAAGLDWLTTVSLHPGRVATDIWRATYFGTDRRGGISDDKGGEAQTPRLQTFLSDIFYNSILTVEEGANTQVMLASRGEPEGSPVKGQYYDYNMRIKKTMNGFAKDESAARSLWERTEQLAGIEFRVE